MCVTTPSSIRTHPFVCAHARTLSSTSTDAIMFVHPMAWIQKESQPLYLCTKPITLHKHTIEYVWFNLCMFLHNFFFLLGILIWYWNFGFIFCNISLNIWFNLTIYSFFKECFQNEIPLMVIINSTNVTHTISNTFWRRLNSDIQCWSMKSWTKCSCLVSFRLKVDLTGLAMWKSIIKIEWNK